MALRNAFQRSSSLLPMRSKAWVIPRALGHRYTLPPNAQRYTVQSDRRLWPLVGFLAVLGGLEICYVVGKNDLMNKKEAMTLTNDISAGELQSAIVKAKPESNKNSEAVTQMNDVSPEDIQHALEEAKSQGVPADDEEKEAYFKQHFSRYEALSEDGSFIQTVSLDR